jgi:regulation of enolase protein 1 (concanavalin A-like superfamily)
MSLLTLRSAIWHNEPNRIDWTDDTLTFETGNKTDFWQATWYGFKRDDGHFLGLPDQEDFSTTVGFFADYVHQYDQAGIMLRMDAHNWIKAGVEFSDNVINFSTVVTRDGLSDWSIIAARDAKGIQHVRLTRQGDSVLTHVKTKDGAWQLLRLAAFPRGKALVGPMACTPERAGLVVKVKGFELGPPVPNALHG